MSSSRSLRASALLAVRSLLWTVLLPGLVAGYVPWRFLGLNRLRLDVLSPGHVAGFLCIGGGAALLGACVWEFARAGRGTLAPVDPPRELVIGGLYRYVRNPMYLSVTMILLGETLLAGSRPLLLYWAAWFLFVNLFVIGYEEPELRRRFGAAYDEYARRVRRWIPSLRA
jgi:protein-S-isoprenylcysteine O-methyltransferase Ste14